MNARLTLSVFSLLVLMAACQKETLPESEATFAPPPSDRCACLAPVEFNARNATDVSIDLSWNTMPEAVAYRVEVTDQFNSSDALGTIIFDEITEGNQITVSHLAPNTRYQYRVTTLCGSDESSTSDVMSFVTADFNPGDPGTGIKKAQAANETSAQ